MNTVEACEGIIKGEVKAFIGLGGNFLRAVPETAAMEEAWPRLRLTVHISTKLNRNHLIHGEVAYLLPCLGRIEIDGQASGSQSVSMENSTACIHGSRGFAEPASPHLLSEPKIVAEIAKATLAPNPKVDWDAWVNDYALVRDAIEATYPEMFKSFNARMWQPGGFHRPLPACERVWKTSTSKANFITPRALEADPDTASTAKDVLQLITVRSNGQFNTTIYGYEDRFHGVSGTRMVLFIHPLEAKRLGFDDGDLVTLRTAVGEREGTRGAGLRSRTSVPEAAASLLSRVRSAHPAAHMPSGARCHSQVGAGAAGTHDPRSEARRVTPEPLVRLPQLSVVGGGC